MNHSEKYSALAAKYLAGQANPAEEQDLFAWSDASTDNQSTFEEWTQAWAMTEHATASPFESDMGAAWAKIDAATPATGPEIVERPAGKIVPLSKIARRWSVAAAVLLSIGAGLWWMNRAPVAQQLQLVEIRTLDNERKAVTLPDSSQVWLNENSRLAFDANFVQRQVNLQGEAFFDVERIVDRPFEITTGDATVTVLGTSFNVRAYEGEEEVEVTVKTGKVALTAKKAKQSIAPLAPGQTGVYNKKEEKVELATIEQENADAWKTQKLAFDDEKLLYVIAALERYFGVVIKVENPALLECNYTTTTAFEQANLEDILMVIGTTVGFEFSKTDGRYVLSGKGCQ
ncbi:MAG: FecR domain-containing protein [Saprospiraceae bacterium]|nr:FecR domain-containing protein [Saprospiraceae bacterium]